MRLAKSIALALSLVIFAPAVVVSLAHSTDPPARSSVELAPAQRLADIAAFRDNFLAKDRSYAPAARAEAERRLTALQAQVATVSQPLFELELARIVALADNGHTHYLLHSISRYYPRAPIRLGVFGQDFYVLRATRANADLLGARLVSIDGHPVAQLRASGRELWGGLPAWRDRFAFELLESPALLHALDLAGDAAKASYVFVTPSGLTIERALSGDPPGPARPFSTPAQAMFPERLPLEDAEWKTALPFDQAPWSLRAAPIPFRSRTAPEIDGLVIELRQNHD